MALVCTTESVESLGARNVDEMFALLSESFLGVRREEFLGDLSEKECAILLRDGTTGAIVGFSTLMTLDLPDLPWPGKAVFSGDTVVREQHRRSPGIIGHVARHLLDASTRHRDHSVYYVLTSKGWRTFRILEPFFREYHPAPEVEPSDEYRAVVRAFAARKYPGRCDVERGIVLARPEAQRVRPGSVDDVPEECSDPLVQFFARANPGHHHGDDLIAVARVSDANVKPLMARLARGRSRP